MTTEIATADPATPAAPTHALGQVSDDWQAAEVWLAVLGARPVSPRTLETYRREIRRLRWYCDTQGASLPGKWTYQDVLAYTRFLNDRATEFASRPGLRPGQAGWTPFRGPLSSGSIADARKVLNTLYGFWTDAGYLRHNPCTGQGAGRRKQAASPSRRVLPAPLIELVVAELDARPKPTVQDHLTYHRDRFTLFLLLRTGIRAHEAAAADMGDIEPRSDPETGRVHWALRLRTQKGGGEGTTWLDATVIAELQRYRTAFGLPAMPAPGEQLGLILSPRTRAGAGGSSARARRHNARWHVVRSRQGVYNVIKELFRAAAARARLAGQLAAAELLERASTHWLRHTRATELVLTHDLRLVAKVMRHKDIRTTMGYTDLDFLDVARALAE